jgi:hypothetical protein
MNYTTSLKSLPHLVAAAGGYSVVQYGFAATTKTASVTNRDERD